MYAKCVKRVLDFLLSLVALSVLSPILLILIVIGAIAMKGNPFFTQRRPGRKEKVFRLLKFRTMSNAKDAEGNLLPDDKRLNGYGKFLRSTSLDELPELFNILVGHMSIVGPRPLLVEYLPWYTEREKMRHSVRPGLTGWAQVNGRNSVDWDTRFELDVEYVENLTFRRDVKILWLTVKAVVSRSDVAEDTRVAEGNFADIRRAAAEAIEAEMVDATK